MGPMGSRMQQGGQSQNAQQPPTQQHVPPQHMRGHGPMPMGGPPGSGDAQQQRVGLQPASQQQQPQVCFTFLVILRFI